MGSSYKILLYLIKLSYNVSWPPASSWNNVCNWLYVLYSLHGTDVEATDNLNIHGENIIYGIGEPEARYGTVNGAVETFM